MSVPRSERALDDLISGRSLWMQPDRDICFSRRNSMAEEGGGNRSFEPNCGIKGLNRPDWGREQNGGFRWTHQSRSCRLAGLGRIRRLHLVHCGAVRMAQDAHRCLVVSRISGRPISSGRPAALMSEYKARPPSTHVILQQAGKMCAPCGVATPLRTIARQQNCERVADSLPIGQAFPQRFNDAYRSRETVKADRR